MAFSKIIFNGTTLMDVTQDTVEADNLLAGETATGADGEQVTGAYVPSGGGVQEVESGVLFIDYDGELLDAWEAADVAGKTALPSNPSHTGLTSQGWNWTLADIKSYIASYPEAILTVGHTYTTTSGSTEIDVTLGTDTLHPYLGVAPNGTVVVDWGDGSATSTLTGSSLTTLVWANHTYSATGNYTIKLTISSGKLGFVGASGATYGSILQFKNAVTQSLLYSSTITAIRLAGNIEVGDRAFSGLINAKYISIPTGITSVGANAFNNGYHRKASILPSGVTTIGNNAYNTCGSMRYMSIPNSVTSIGSAVWGTCEALYAMAFPTGVTTLQTNVCYACAGLYGVTIPSGVTSIGSTAFQYCHTLRKVNIPNTVTSIASSAFYSCYVLPKFSFSTGMTSTMQGSLFYNGYGLVDVTIPEGITSVGASAFYNCVSLPYVTIPSTVTTIGSQAFYNCRALMKIRFERATPPTVSASSAWTSVNNFCVISVPVGSLSAYTSASNYPSSSSFTYIEEA